MAVHHDGMIRIARCGEAARCGEGGMLVSTLAMKSQLLDERRSGAMEMPAQLYF